MMAWWALLGALVCQDPNEAIQKLRQENDALRQQTDELRQQALDDARTIGRLRQALKAQEALAESRSPEPPLEEEKRLEASVNVIRGRVEYVDARNNFVVIDKGEKDGIKQGFKFEVLRENFPPGGAPAQIVKIALAEFEKFLGNEHSMSKLTVVEGKASDIRAEDEAVAIRRLDPVPPQPPEPSPPSRPGVHKITGRVSNNGYVLNYGSLEGARQSDVVMVYKNGRLKAKLRLDTVEKNFSVGYVVEGMKVADPDLDDQVFSQEVRRAIIGRVQLNDERGIFVDVGQNNMGVKAGQRLEVRRQGQKVGVIRLTTVEKFWSWGRPEPDTKAEEIKVGDFVELIDEKKS